MQRIRIWDWPTRLVHWLLVALVFFSWGSAKYQHMDLHRYSGYTVLGLLMFRLYWGFVGSDTARFSRFIKGPSSVLAYLRAPSTIIGHNPLGALSVMVLLALLIAQVTLGLFAVDIDGLESGPLSYLVSFETGRASAKLHANVFNFLLGFIALHVAAIFYYLLVRRDNLIGPMVTGNKLVPESAQATAVSTPLLRFLIGVAIAGGLVWLIT
jgi:cytochrome b